MLQQNTAEVPARAMNIAHRGFELARDLRTAALWLLGPADALQRKLRGETALPPLWLRRHAGPIKAFESAARDMEATIREQQLVSLSDCVLDLGCGCGAMVPAFRRLLGDRGNYIGVDVHRPSIAWARRHFSYDRRLIFEWAAVASPYGDRASSRPVESYRFPAADGYLDFILAKSLFTHLREEPARSYLREIARTLRRGGRALVTTFLFDRGTRPPAFRFPEADASFRWARRLRVEAAVAFDRRYFEEMVSDVGLVLERTICGFWPGTAPIPTGQDVLILLRP